MSRSKPREIADHVRELIVTGQVVPDSFLRLDLLAADLNSSVTPVREALIQLATEGFLEQYPRRGFKVLPITDQDLADVYAAQSWLSGELAARAVRTMSRRDLDGLERLQVELEAAAARGAADEVERCNHGFHRTINVAAEVPRLAVLLKLTSRYAPRLFFANVSGWPEASATDHRQVIVALRAGDPDAAREAMSAHVRRAGELLVAHRARGAGVGVAPS
ncbi:GntR family transcriptional regulator [Micromonospora sp. NPDC049051]|uniref:GntR family transcriptional regulator n=1 Tax=unclassified Micromonospora TaxID=2617518 RepID=UPI0037208725